MAGGYENGANGAPDAKHLPPATNSPTYSVPEARHQATLVSDAAREEGAHGLRIDQVLLRQNPRGLRSAVMDGE